MPAGLTKTDDMFSVRETPWHGMGVVLEDHPSSVDDALKKAGLDWTVEQRPVLFPKLGATSDVASLTADDLGAVTRESADGSSIPAAYVNVRSDNGEALGVVSDRYSVMQNKQAFSFLANLLGTDLLFETAGSLSGGRRVWVQARTPEWIEVGGDATVPFVFITNSHDGYRAVRAKAGGRRIVCQNTLSWALAEATNTYAIAHLGDPTSRLHEARKVLEITVNYAKQFKELGDRLASQKLTEAKLKKVLAELYPTDDSMSERKVMNRTDARNHIGWLFREGPTVGNAPGSAWCALNAICEFVDYGEKTDHDGKLTRVMDDPTGIKKRALPLVAAAAGVGLN